MCDLVKMSHSAQLSIVNTHATPMWLGDLGHSRMILFIAALHSSVL